jgi:hypothetical protein
MKLSIFGGWHEDIGITVYRKVGISLALSPLKVDGGCLAAATEAEHPEGGFPPITRRLHGGFAVSLSEIAVAHELRLPSGLTSPPDDEEGAP